MYAKYDITYNNTLKSVRKTSLINKSMSLLVTHVLIFTVLKNSFISVFLSVFYSSSDFKMNLIRLDLVTGLSNFVGNPKLF